MLACACVIRYTNRNAASAGRCFYLAFGSLHYIVSVCNTYVVCTHISRFSLHISASIYIYAYVYIYNYIYIYIYISYHIISYHIIYIYIYICVRVHMYGGLSLMYFTRASSGSSGRSTPVGRRFRAQGEMGLGLRV